MIFSKMSPLRSSLLLLFTTSSLASPAFRPRDVTVTVTQTASSPPPTAMPWDFGAVTEFPIHASCNRTEAAQISRGLAETMQLVTHARDHILRWGNPSSIYQKYFGNASTGEPIGWFEKISKGDKAGVLFRCDDPDKNCHQDGKTFPSPVSSLLRLNKSRCPPSCHLIRSYCSSISLLSLSASFFSVNTS